MDQIQELRTEARPPRFARGKSDLLPPGLWTGARAVPPPPTLAPEGGPAEKPDPWHLACLEGHAGEPILDEIAREIAERSVLRAFADWRRALHGSADNDAPVFRKLMRLFEIGVTPARVIGHHDGMAFGLRTGDEPASLAPHGNLMNVLWSATVRDAPPWVGKSFSPLERDELQRLTDGFERGDNPCSLGINHFRRVPSAPISAAVYGVLTAWMGLRDAPPRERALYGHDRDGGLFIAKRARSLWTGTPREVCQLNYRWTALGGRPPFSWLVDELVELSPGLYLGQLLFATARLLEGFNPYLAPVEYRYQHFGHFVLTDDRWADEARRAFPSLGDGLAARPGPALPPDRGKALTLADPPEGRLDDARMAEIRGELDNEDTILDLLLRYSKQLFAAPNDSAVFDKLAELFNRGRCPTPEALRGYQRGALISFHAEGYYRLFDKNTLNAAWALGRLLTPWTGKTFEDIDRARLAELTGGVERGEVPTLFGTNTLSFKKPGAKVIGLAMRLARIPMERAPKEEAARGGYDAKSYYFIAREGRSINPDNDGKRVVQFNYRWPALRTFPPDNYCIDELSQIAEGLYLGQLIYATEHLHEPFDPRRPPEEYRYRVFGYFLLMDEAWHRRRLEIGLDPDNV